MSLRPAGMYQAGASQQTLGSHVTGCVQDIGRNSAEHLYRASQHPVNQYPAAGDVRGPACNTDISARTTQLTCSREARDRASSSGAPVYLLLPSPPPPADQLAAASCLRCVPWLGGPLLLDAAPFSLQGPWARGAPLLPPLPTACRLACWRQVSRICCPFLGVPSCMTPCLSSCRLPGREAPLCCRYRPQPADQPAAASGFPEGAHTRGAGAGELHACLSRGHSQTLPTLACKGTHARKAQASAIH